MSRYLSLDTSKLQEAYRAYFKATVAMGNHMPLDYGRWLEYRMVELERELAAANAKIVAVESVVAGVRTLVEYPAADGIRDIGDILEGKNSTTSKE